MIMWAVRRSANQVKICSEHIKALRSAATLVGSYNCSEYNNERSVQAYGFSIDRNISFAVYAGIARGFASQATGSVQEKKENKDEIESLSELDVLPEEASLSDSDGTGYLALDPEGEVSEGEDQVGSGLSEAKGEGNGPSKRLLEDILKCTYGDVPATIDKWVEDGNDFNRQEAENIFRQLKNRDMYGRALRLCLQSFLACVGRPLCFGFKLVVGKKSSLFDDSDHAARLDLIFRLYGISAAEKHFQTIPSEMRGYKVHQIRLQNFTRMCNVTKAEEVFNNMKDAGFTPHTFDYNALLKVYLRTGTHKVSNLLKMMEDENIKPDVVTYNHLIHDKGVVGDIVGMEKILENMKADGIQTDQPATLAKLASNYIRAGYPEKAEALLKELEDFATAKGGGGCLKILLLLYADIGKPSDVERVWNAITSLPQISTSYYIAGIRAWGKLGEIAKAESMFEKTQNSGMKVTSPVAYSALLNVYVDHNLFLKAKEFVKRMTDNRQIVIQPFLCEAMVKLYLGFGDIKEANAFLLKVGKQKQVKPFYVTFIAILEKYAEKGDIANAENIFDSLIKAGYRRRIRSYECLLQAYLKAHIPAYGFKERMLAAKLRPNQKINSILLQMDAFKKERLQSNGSAPLD